MTTTLPTSRPQLPVLGDTFPVLTDPFNYFHTRFLRYGKAFQTRILGKPSVVIYGADAQQHILVAGSNTGAFTVHEGYTFAEPFMMNSLLQIDGDEHLAQRKLLLPAFQSRNYGEYLTRMNRAFDHTMGSWSDQGTKPFFHEARSLAFRVATSLMLGVEEGEELAKISDMFHTMFAGPVALLKLALPFTTYGKARAVQPLLEEHLLKIVRQHRENPVNDVLTLLLQARDEEGEPLSDERLCSHLKLLLFAGYDTTTSALAFGVLELLRHPELAERLFAEIKVDEIGGEVPVTMEEIRSVPFLDAFMKETLRLHTPSAFLMRANKQDCEIEGVPVPAGWQIIIPTIHNHRSPEYFADPDRFDPERFLPPREEDKKSPHSWMVFGGGRHTCLGMGIAQVEFKAVFIRLLRQFQIQLVPNQDTRTVYIPTGHPKDGALITFQRRKALVPAIQTAHSI